MKTLLFRSALYTLFLPSILSLGYSYAFQASFLALIWVLLLRTSLIQTRCLSFKTLQNPYPPFPKWMNDLSTYFANLSVERFVAALASIAILFFLDQTEVGSGNAGGGNSANNASASASSNAGRAGGNGHPGTNIGGSPSSIIDTGLFTDPNQAPEQHMNWSNPISALICIIYPLITYASHFTIIFLQAFFAFCSENPYVVAGTLQFCSRFVLGQQYAIDFYRKPGCLRRFNMEVVSVLGPSLKCGLVAGTYKSP